MPKHRMPYIPFYHGDFLNGVSGLNAQERGVYITLLALMWEHGEPITSNPSYLARQCGTTVPAFKKCLQVLIDLGKIKEDEDGLWNARAREEIEKREAKSKAAASSARSKKSSQKEKSKTVGHKSSFQQDEKFSGPKPAENKGLGEANATQTLSEQGAIRDTDKPPIVPQGDKDRFEEFWNAYPKRQGENPKHPAKLKFIKLTPGEQQKAIVAAREYAIAQHRLGKIGSEYIAQAKTWLNQRRWEGVDEVEKQSEDNSEVLARIDKILGRWPQETE